MAFAMDGLHWQCSGDWIGFFTILASVQIVGPLPHHLSPLRQVNRTVVGTPERITHHMGQLVCMVRKCCIVI